MQVKRNPHEHDCHSTRRSGMVKCATKYWVCEKVKDWVLENPKVTAKELQRRIKDEYKVLVHYKRVLSCLVIGKRVLTTCTDSSLKLNSLVLVAL